MGLGLAAIMRWLCAVRAGESRRESLPRGAARPASVADLRRQLARLLDQLLDRPFGRQNPDQFALGVHVFHVLGQARRIAVGEFAHRGDAGRTGGGDHFHVTVVSEQFDGLSLVEQHKLRLRRHGGNELNFLRHALGERLHCEHINRHVQPHTR